MLLFCRPYHLGVGISSFPFPFNTYSYTLPPLPVFTLSCPHPKPLLPHLAFVGDIGGRQVIVFWFGWEQAVLFAFRELFKAFRSSMLCLSHPKFEALQEKLSAAVPSIAFFSSLIQNYFGLYYVSVILLLLIRMSFQTFVLTLDPKQPAFYY